MPKGKLADSGEFLRELLTRLLDAAADKARPNIPKRLGHLRDALDEDIPGRITGPASGRLLVNRSYAVFVHDPLGPRTKDQGVYVWFTNPADDPRVDSRGERKPGAAGHLDYSKEEFLDLMQRGVIRVQHEVGPMNLQDGMPGFFDNDRGMAGFVNEAHQIVKPMFNDFVREFMGEDLDIKG